MGLHRDTKSHPLSQEPCTSIEHVPRLKAQAQVRSAQRKAFIEMFLGQETLGAVQVLGDRDMVPHKLLVSRRLPGTSEPCQHHNRSTTLPMGPALAACCRADKGRDGDFGTMEDHELWHVPGTGGDGWFFLHPQHCPPSIKHLFQVGIQEDPRGIQLLPNRAEFGEGWVHLLKVLPGAAVGLQEEQCLGGMPVTGSGPPHHMLC